MGIYHGDPIFQDFRGEWVAEYNSNVHIFGYRSEKSAFASRMWVWDFGDIVCFVNFYSKSNKGGMRRELTEMYLKAYMDDGEWVHNPHQFSDNSNEGLPYEIRDIFVNNVRQMFYCNHDFEWFRRKPIAECSYDLSFNVVCGCRVTPDLMLVIEGIGVVCMDCYGNKCAKCGSDFHREDGLIYSPVKGKTYCNPCIKETEYYIKDCMLCDRPVIQMESSEESAAYDEHVCVRCTVNKTSCGYCGHMYYGHQLCTCEADCYDFGDDIPTEATQDRERNDYDILNDSILLSTARRSRSGRNRNIHCIKCCHDVQILWLSGDQYEMLEAEARGDKRDHLPAEDEPEET